MKTLFHGGTDIINQPEIRVPNRTLDFGAGFYLTSSEQQAIDWVKRRNVGSSSGVIGYINQYLAEFSKLRENLNVKVFETASNEWLDFVMVNRKNPNFNHQYDVVVGPVANDRVYTAFALYEAGTIGRETLIAELKTYRLVNQFLFHTEKSLDFLKFLTATEVRI